MVGNQRVGNYEDLTKVFRVWYEMAKNDRGRVELPEMERFMASQNCEQFTSWVWAELLDSPYNDDTTTTFDAIVGLLWPCASEVDVHLMIARMNGTTSYTRASTPPMLPKDRRAELRSLFSELDADGSGTISADELVALGLPESVAEEWVNQVTASDGEFDFEAFVEMMCPHGYRSNSKVSEVFVYGDSDEKNGLQRLQRSNSGHWYKVNDSHGGRFQGVVKR